MLEKGVSVVYSSWLAVLLYLNEEREKKLQHEFCFKPDVAEFDLIRSHRKAGSKLVSCPFTFLCMPSIGLGTVFCSLPLGLTTEFPDLMAQAVHHL